MHALIISKKNKLTRIIMRRLTVFWKLVIFWAVIGFSGNFAEKLQNVTLRMSSKSLDKKDDSGSYDRILESCNVFGLNGVK